MLVAALCACPDRSSLNPRPAALQSLPAPYLFASDGTLSVACGDVATGWEGVLLGHSCRSKLWYTWRFRPRRLEMSRMEVSRLSRSSCEAVRMTKSEVHRAGRAADPDRILGICVGL